MPRNSPPASQGRGRVPGGRSVLAVVMVRMRQRWPDGKSCSMLHKGARQRQRADGKRPHGSQQEPDGKNNDYTAQTSLLVTYSYCFCPNWSCGMWAKKDGYLRFQPHVRRPCGRAPTSLLTPLLHHSLHAQRPLFDPEDTLEME